MDYFDALYRRKSVRGFLPGEPIPLDSLKKVLSAAARSASSKNVQPWEVRLLQGNSLEAFRADFSHAYDQNTKPNRPFTTYPQPLPPQWDKIAHELGAQVFAVKGIERRDLAARQEHARQNYIFFNAPQVMYLVSRRDAEKGTFLDLGMFLGSVLNGIAAEGYAGVPMFTSISYADIVCRHLKLPEELQPICGVAMGKESDAVINSLHTPRRPLEDWFQVLD